MRGGPMRVGLDAHMIGARETGNETYVRGLIGALPGVAPDLRYVLYTASPDLARQGLSDAPVARTRLLRPASPWIRLPIGLPLAARRDRLDVLHVTYHAPPRSPCRTVVTVHDLSFMAFPNTFGPRDLLVLSTLVPLSARRARAVIVPSEHTRRDLIRAYGLPPDKIVVTPEAADARFSPSEDAGADRAVVRRLGLVRPYILALGTLQPRKNFERLVEAYAALRRSGRTDHHLVIVGKAGRAAARLRERIARLGLEERVHLRGYLAAADVPAVYRAATCFVFPSLYEGFGLPVLEAMACGTPVIASNQAAVPEVAGDAAVLVDPYRVGELAGAIERVLADPALRARLRAGGLARAATFSWEETARRTAEVYRAAARAAVARR